MTTPLHVVRYTGPFGYIKPWTAVRDGETYSQQFLTPSIIEGMRQKLEVSAILRHRLRCSGFSEQQETTQSRDWQKRPTKSILTRGVMINPVLHLAFANQADAEQAATQHLCLCRSEDMVYPLNEPQELSAENFDKLPGIELFFTEEESSDSFCVGFNRYQSGKAMYGSLQIVGSFISEGRE